MTTKELILESAIKVFAKKGFEPSSVDDIAKTANVAKGTLYYHFQSKDEILIAIINRGIDQFTAELENNIKDETNPARKLEIAINTQLDFFYKFRNFCLILLTEIWHFEIKWKKHVEKIQKNYLKVIEEIIADGIKSGQFSPDLDVEAATVSVFSLISFSSLDWAIFHGKRPREDMLKTAKTMLLKGLAK